MTAPGCVNFVYNSFYNNQKEVIPKDIENFLTRYDR